MSKKQLIDRHAHTLKSWVGTTLCKDAIEQRCNEQCLGCYTYKRD